MEDLASKQWMKTGNWWRELLGGWAWWATPVSLAIAVGATYFCAAQLSLALLTKPGGVAVFWPAAGISAGTLIALGASARLPVVAGVAVASTLASLLGDRSIPAATVFTLCNVGEPLFVAWLLHRLYGDNLSLDSLSKVTGFFLVSGLGPAISGGVATVGFILFYDPTASALTTWLNWFASDALGIVMVAPLLIGLNDLRGEPPEKWELGLGALTLAALIMVAVICLSSPEHYWYTALPLGMLLPALLAAHCRPVFAAAASLVLGVAVVWTTTFGLVHVDIDEASRLLDRASAGRAILLAISATTLVLAALFAERRSALAALVDSNGRLADGLAAGNVVAFEWDAVTSKSKRSHNARPILGDDQGSHFLNSVHPEDRTRFKECIRGLSPKSPSYTLSFRYCSRDGRQLCLEERGRAEFDSAGRLLRVKGLTRDISDRKMAELALAERTMQLSLAGKVAMVGSFAYDTNAEEMQISAGYAAIHGLPDGADNVVRRDSMVSVHADDVAQVELARRDAFRTRRGEYNVEYRVVRPDHEVRWVEKRCFISYDSYGRPQRAVGVCIDITQRRRSEERQRTLNAELDHRVKNVLATVSAIISHSRQSTVQANEAALHERIQSMARTHELLSLSQWFGVSLPEIARRELAPFGVDSADIFGAPVILKPEAAQSVGMVLHELTTNAAKYGALSAPSGRVSLRWRWAENGSDERLAIDWQESGGPPILEPKKCGYGTSTIREAIPFELGGTVDLSFAPSGLRCQIEIPAEWVCDARPAAQVTQRQELGSPRTSAGIG